MVQKVNLIILINPKLIQIIWISSIMFIIDCCPYQLSQLIEVFFSFFFSNSVLTEVSIVLCFRFCFFLTILYIFFFALFLILLVTLAAIYIFLASLFRIFLAKSSAFFISFSSFLFSATCSFAVSFLATLPCFSSKVNCYFLPFYSFSFIGLYLIFVFVSCI